MPQVSVVVPTRNRATSLAVVLTALQAQEGIDFEVIVVDDASTDGTPALLATWEGPNRLVLRQEEPLGSYAARNRGWQVASGEFIVLTDDDCVPHPGWLAALTRPFAEGVVGVQGCTLPGPGEITPFTHQIEQRHPGPPYRTCNIAYRKAVLEAIGGFRPWRWYADNVMGYEALRLGAIAWAPDALVLHPPRPREWRHRSVWRQRFVTDAAHRQELRRLGVEKTAVSERILPLLLWVLRPLVKQSGAHVRYFVRHPALYLRGVLPLLTEKGEMLLAIGDMWKRGSDNVERERLAPESEEAPLVSVVVVTRERETYLVGALQALAGQTYARVEIVVVENCAGEAARPVTEGIGARYVTAPDMGLGAARQVGVDASAGEIVAFTDDDCLPHPDWLWEIVRAFQRQPHLLAVQGRTVPEDSPVGSQAIGVSGPDSLYRTCNIVYRREALRAVGGFDAAFMGWFEDTALGARVSRLGSIGFAPEAVVTHRARTRQPLDRDRWRALLADERRLASRYGSFYRRTRGPAVLPTVIARWLLGSAVKTLIREAPAGTKDPSGYLRLVRVVLMERRELVLALYEEYAEARSPGSGGQ